MTSRIAVLACWIAMSTNAADARTPAETDANDDGGEKMGRGRVEWVAHRGESHDAPENIMERLTR